MTKWTRKERVVNKRQDPTLTVTWKSDNGIELFEFFGDIQLEVNGSRFSDKTEAHLLAVELFNKLEEVWQHDLEQLEPEPKGYYL